MKTKNGFVFIETIVVVAVLTMSLLLVYASYNSALVKEKSRLRYNDTVYLYRSYYIVKFLKRNGLSDLKDIVNSNELTIFNCTNTLLSLSDTARGFCTNMFNEFHISKVYISYNDLSYIQNCPSSSEGDCAQFKRNQALYSYASTIGGNESEGYRIILEFSETEDGAMCKAVNCKYSYTTFSLGDLENEE